MELDGLRMAEKIDFTKGFTSYHIKWPIKKLSSPTMCSSKFTTTTPSKLDWALGTQEQEDDDGNKTVFFGLFGEEQKTSSAILCRLALCREKDQFSYFNQPFVFFYHQQQIDGQGRSFPIDAADGDDLVLHCWIDIPIGIPKIERKRKFDGGDGASQGASINNLDMFKGVMNENKYFKSRSDITLVLVGEDVKDARRFFCHEIILASSPFFREKFVNNKWKKGIEEGKRIIEIEGFNEKTMEFILRYIYTRDLTVEENNGNDLSGNDGSVNLDLLRAAIKFCGGESTDLTELIKFCTTNVIFYNDEDRDRIDQIIFADENRLEQLKACSLAALCTNLAALNENDLAKGGPISKLLRVSTNRQASSTEITVKTEKHH